MIGILVVEFLSKKNIFFKNYIYTLISPFIIGCAE